MEARGEGVGPVGTRLKSSRGWLAPNHLRGCRKAPDRELELLGPSPCCPLTHLGTFLSSPDFSNSSEQRVRHSAPLDKDILSPLLPKWQCSGGLPPSSRALFPHREQKEDQKGWDHD